MLNAILERHMTEAHTLSHEISVYIDMEQTFH